MPAIHVRSDGTRYCHTSVDIPETLAIEAKKRGVSISKITSDALREQFAIDGVTA